MHITNLVPNTRNNNPSAKLADGYTLVFFIREGLTQLGLIEELVHCLLEINLPWTKNG